MSSNRITVYLSNMVIREIRIGSKQIAAAPPEFSEEHTELWKALLLAQH